MAIEYALQAGPLPASWNYGAQRGSESITRNKQRSVELRHAGICYYYS